MKKFNILITTSAVVFLATGCVKPTENTAQPIYTDNTAAPIVYEQAAPIVYEPAVGTVYEDIQQDGTVITTTGVTSQQGVGGITYPDPYANNSGGGTVYNDPYANQPVLSDYPTTPASSSGGQGGGIHLQIAALKEYFTAEDYKNRLSLPPGLTAYVQRGAMNKVIVSGIPSMTEANRLKESRFPGAFIVQGASSGGYTPAVQPNYETPSGTYSSGAYNVNNPYGTSSSNVSGNLGIGVQIGAFGSKGKAQSVANRQNGRYPATVKKIGQYYKVILTGFSSRSAAKAHAGTIGGFVVDVY